jgi:predicted ATPase
MITQLNIQNFKSLRKAQLPLGKINVMTGANNSGKSSFIYGLLSLKNTISNPNQSLDACLTLPFINLGGFQQTVFDKDESQQIILETVFREGDIEVAYKLALGKIISFLEINSLKPFRFSAKLDIAFPYPANKTLEFEFQNLPLQAKFNWNGILAKVISVTTTALLENPVDATQIKIVNEATTLLKKIFQLPLYEFAKIDFVPIRRGFTQPYFNPVPLGAQISTEEQIATLLEMDRDLANKVTYYLEKIVDRAFSVHTPSGISTIYLQAMDKANGFTSDLVNEGLGTNQLVTILAKVMQKSTKFICIDEPEIHLHPSIIDKLVSVMVEIANEEGKQFLVSTHSEHFINSLLKNVAEGKIKSDEVKVYYLSKARKETVTEFQAINVDGQIRGGLKNFYDTELSNMKTFFKIAD